MHVGIDDAQGRFAIRGNELRLRSARAVGPSLGITLVPAPLLALVPVPLDGTGSFTWTVPGGGGPQTVVLQAFQLAPGGASISSSNALELQLLP